MEKLEHDYQSDDYSEFDDVLDQAFFNDFDELVDLEEDEDNYENKSDEFRSISEL